MTSMTGMTQDELDRNETVTLIASDKVEGTPVYNAEGEKLGSVDKLMIDKRGGRVSYAVMAFGGFLGLGESYHPLPWDVLTYDTELEGYVVALTREQLEGAPRYARGDEPVWSDRAYKQSIHDYYGSPPRVMML
ncbi:PRC-barrel domain-containing protein [Oceanicella sp. SM1341]|uniref:PRC-barrel domain-containing protein n=1 Tax=Oceanicella sp. SM1341 TaxID=1548889 RepID=UPI001E5D51FF|nr:PRC-barrel domain-containing protein [Oceanicella sp. SM1341]